MLLHPKSMHIEPLTQCFWRKMKLKIALKQYKKSAMHYLSTIYKRIKCRAYLTQDTSLFANTPAMKRFDVKKIHHHESLLEMNI